RRHTRLQGDWSSDVCSSDLRFVRFHAMQSILYSAIAIVFRIGWSILVSALTDVSGWAALVLVPVGLVISLGLFCFWLFLMYQARSEERRVGKECRSQLYRSL